MTKLNPYLNFDGTTEEAFTFYKSVFGGEFLGGIMRMNAVPGMEKLPENEQNRVMHVALPVGDSVLMASDICPSMGHKMNQGNNSYISITVDSREEADRLFKELTEGGKVEMPMTDMFWGDYWGSFADRFGVQWMISYRTAGDQNQ
ncbi:glyoxalase [Niabella ginsenosidivorans]|uniref:Glyoxalase n=1 Tax=Niabella ginsenosidivorans TaxID=1176587 RepID=A0A1A9I353_9BACT|nr:VOC family protein [Niabella ginsenosidivorans]ANH82098.1 glyoxalase [Niabella ginsenosidivorans]